MPIEERTVEIGTRFGQRDRHAWPELELGTDIHDHITPPVGPHRPSHGEG